MARLRRTAVYVALQETVGHDLIFKHYTNKVVVGKYSEIKMKRFSEQPKKKNDKRNSEH